MIYVSNCDLSCLQYQEDVDIAVAAARKAVEYGSPWRTMDASERGRLMYKWADAIERDLDYIAVSLILDRANNFFN